jgi:hypothetical protein
MREIWYGDRRDIVKWACVYETAKWISVKNVVQVLFHRKSYLSISSSTAAPMKALIDDKIFEHFQYDLMNASDLCKQLDLTLAFIEADDFSREQQPDKTEWAAAYVAKVRQQLQSIPLPTVVLLDPDTGIEPESPTLEHVLNKEVREIFSAMNIGSGMLFYQHRPLGAKRGEGWITEKRDKFEKSFETKPAEIRTMFCSDVAKDVVFFVVKKG